MFHREGLGKPLFSQTYLTKISFFDQSTPLFRYHQTPFSHITQPASPVVENDVYGSTYTFPAIKPIGLNYLVRNF